jgi:hypothetical protein
MSPVRGGIQGTIRDVITHARAGLCRHQPLQQGRMSGYGKTRCSISECRAVILTAENLPTSSAVITIYFSTMKM